MPRYNRINLDGLQHIASAPSAAQTLPGDLVNLVGGKFVAATAGLLRAYAVHTSDLSTDVEDPILIGGNINGDKVESNRTFALRLVASQTVALDDELFIVEGGLTTTGTAGEGQFWANESVTTGVGENFLISVTVK